MIFLLLISLILMLILSYMITKDILSPWVVSVCMFLLSVMVATLNYNYWNEDIGAITVLVILIGLSSFGLGEVFGKTILSKKTRDQLNSSRSKTSLLNSGQRIFISNRWILVTSMIIVIVTYFNYQFILSIAIEAGYRSGLGSMLYYARYAQFNPEINSNLNMIMSIGVTFSRVFSYFFIFVFLYNTIFFKFKLSSSKYLIPSLLNFGNILLSTGRTEFINLITVFLILLFIMLKQKYNWKSKVNFKIILYGVIGITVFLIIFRLSGYLTGKSERAAIWDNFSVYIGASIVALDKYLLNRPEQLFFGKETLSSIYHILRIFGFNIPYYHVPSEFVSWENVNVNIYTSLRRYIQDFTIWGMTFIQFFLGFFYGGYYHYIKLKNKVSLGLIIYAMIFFPIVQASIEERFFMKVISVAGIYNLLAISLLWYFFIVKRKNKILKVKYKN